MTNNKLSGKRLSEIAGKAPWVKYSHDEVQAMAAELQEYRKAAGEPVAFDALRDAVAEVTGGLPVEFDEGHIYKGHQSVPFMNFNSLSRIVEKFRTPQPAQQ